jgi:Helix-turn-helix of DDE superfamily endonuclease/DDE superfamily endonuclease
LLALTGLARREFDELLPVFTEALAEAETANKPKPKKRQRAPGGGRKPSLGPVEDKLLFILVYTKTYPLQVVQGEMFGMSQPSANDWIQALLPVLRESLDRLGVLPERDGAQAAGAARRRGEPADLIVDGVERRRQRPKDPTEQVIHYSGKKKTHSDKNVLVVNTASRRVSYLSPTLPGAAHDKALADYAKIQYPHNVILRSDSAFIGYAPCVRQHLQPKKNPRSTH